MRSLLLALFIFGTIPFIFQRPYIGLLVWSWIGYMNPHRLTYGFTYDFPWVMLIAIVTLIALFMSKENKRIPLSAVSLLLFALLLWTGVTTIFAVQQPSALHKWEEFAKILVMVFVTFMLVQDRKRMHLLVWVIAVSLGFWGFKGGISTILHGGHYRVFGPAKSFITDNNAFALAMCMTLPLMRYLQLHSKKKWVRLGLVAAMLITGVSILGTYSRGGLIGLGIVSVALLVKGRRRFVVLAFLGVVGVAGYHFMPPQWTARMATLHDASQTDSGETRIQSWKFAFNVARHRPFTGGGFNDYQSAWLWNTYAPEGSIQRAIHSIYFRYLGEQGFVGLFLFLALLAASWRCCSRVRKKTRHLPDQKWAYDLASMLQVSVIAYMAAGAFLPMSYFDLAYQLFAMCALLPRILPEPAREPSLQPAYAASRTPSLPRAVPAHQTRNSLSRQS